METFVNDVIRRGRNQDGVKPNHNTVRSFFHDFPKKSGLMIILEKTYSNL
jgi:hypothetical protein